MAGTRKLVCAVAAVVMLAASVAVSSPATAQAPSLSFGDAAVSPRVYTVGVRATQQLGGFAGGGLARLPEATGGTWPYAYSAVGLPEGLHMTPDRVIRGIPTVATDVPVAVTYTVTDGLGAAGSLTFVVAVNPPVSFDAGSVGAVEVSGSHKSVRQLRWGIHECPVGVPVRVVLPPAYGGTGALSYHLWDNDTARPLAEVVGGLSFDSASRVLSGTPTRAGRYAVTYWAQDRNGATVSAYSSISFGSGTQGTGICEPGDGPVTPRAPRAPLFDAFTAPTRSGIDLERLASAVESIDTAADCTAVPALSVEGITVVPPPAGLNDPDAPLTVAEVTRIAGGCVVVEYVLLAGRTVAQVRELLAAEATVHAVGEPPRGVYPAHSDADGVPHGSHADPHHNDGGGEQWHLPQPTMSRLWTGWIGDGDPDDGDSDDGRQIVVAVLDTGVDVTHPDLDDRIVSSLGGCHDTDQHGHGTHVAGIIAAEHDTSVGATNQHVAGVAPKASILPIRVLETEHCPTGTLGLSITAGVAAAINAGADVINMSLSKTTTSSETVNIGGAELPGKGVSGDTLELALRAASMQGIVTVAAVGNCGRQHRGPDRDTSTCGGVQHRELFPSLYEHDVISVAAVGRNGARSDFSSENRLVDIAAPGAGILSTFPTANRHTIAGAYTCTALKQTRPCTLGDNSGTSMAAPFVSGVVAHLLNRHPQATPGLMREALQSTARQPAGVTGRTDALGWGVVDPAAALAKLARLLDAQLVDASDHAGGFVSVVASGENTCALRHSGAVVCWGDDADGRSMPPQLKYRSIEASQDFSTPGTGGHACGILDDGISGSDGRGLARCWGLGTTRSALDYSARGAFSEVSVGNLFTCGLRPDTAVPAAGQARSGGRAVCWMHPPDRSPFRDGRHLVPADARFVQLSAGWLHGCGVKPDGHIECWGYNDDGQADHRLVAATLAGGFTQVASGRYHSCALYRSGTPVCWGESRRNAAESTGATQPPAGVKFTSLSAHRDITCGLRTDTGVACWGDDTYGQVSGVPAGTGFISIDAGDDHVCAVRRTAASTQADSGSGYVTCWGRDDLGQVTPPSAGKLTRLHVDCPTSACARAGSIVADFDPDTSAYVASSRPVAGYLTVTAESMPFTAPPGTVKITPADSRPTLAGHQVDLSGGQPVTITATVSHPYNDTERTYTVTVPRPDAALDTLSVRPVTCDTDCTVGTAVGLSPAFDTATGAYTATVDAATDLVEIAYTAVAADTHVQITPADSSSAVDGHQVRLAAGQTTRVRLVVTVVKRELPSAPVSQIIYTIDLTRP
ncbi:S8 family serine peptidase [Candidatus Poriferisodalis sp.]|uniref:S8 family serine peptidase n=1 Tax=Candidatus Poriferisodalis sp. TaxID=3101277 RepID=UPI003B022A12